MTTTTDAFATPPAGSDDAPEPAIPAGMKAYGPDHPDYPNAPGDWDGGRVRRRHGGMSMPDGQFAWSSAGGGLGNIIAYTPEDPRGGWRRYDGSGELPKGCDPHSYVDICGEITTGIDIPAHQAFDREVTGWRPSIDDAFRAERETRAKAIYDAWKHQEGWEPWVERGNSLMQDKARGLASQQMANTPTPSDVSNDAGGEGRHSPHSIVVKDGDDGMMPVEVLRGNFVYLWQGDAQLTVTPEHARKIAAALSAPPPVQAGEVEDLAYLRSVATEDLGYPSILEALEAAPHASTPVSQPIGGGIPHATNAMLDAGVVEMRVSTHADRGVALDVWNAMHRAGGIEARIRAEGAKPNPTMRVVQNPTFGPHVVVDGVPAHDMIVVMVWDRQLQPRHLRLPGQAYVKDLLALMDATGADEVAIQPCRYTERLSITRAALRQSGADEREARNG